MKISYDKIFVLTIFLYPILFIYYGGFLSFTLADIIYLPILVYGGIKLIISKKTISSNYAVWTGFCIYFVFFSIFIILYIGKLDIILKHFRYLVYVLSITIYTPHYFNKNYAIELFKIICRFTSGFAIIQAIGIYGFGKYIPGILGFLPLSDSYLLEYGTNYSSGILRVKSFFVEPSHMAVYLCCGLVVTLFSDYSYKSKIFNKITDSILIVIALFFSVSSTAYYLTAMIWGIYSVYQIRISQFNKRKVERTLFLLFVFSILLYAAINSQFFELFLDRNYRGNASSYTGRMNGYDIFSFSQKNIAKLFGNGFIDVPIGSYLPSIPLVFWRMGYFGLVIYLMTFIGSLKKAHSTMDRIIIITFIVLGLGTQAYFSYMLMLYFGFVNSKSTGDIQNE